MDEAESSAPVELSEQEFEELVGRALDRIPEEFLDLIENCVIAIEEDSPPEQPPMLGLYEGVAITERGVYAGAIPDVITLYQRPLQQICHTVEELEHEVFITVVHEIGHYFGIDDDRLHELDWA